MFQFIFPKKIQNMMELMPTSFPEKTIKLNGKGQSPPKEGY